MAFLWQADVMAQLKRCLDPLSRHATTKKKKLYQIWTPSDKLSGVYIYIIHFCLSQYINLLPSDGYYVQSPQCLNSLAKKLYQAGLGVYH